MNKSTLYGNVVVILFLALATPVYSGGFIVHSSEGSEVIGVDKDAVTISPEDGKPHFKDESKDNWKMTDESKRQQNADSVKQVQKDAQYKAEQKRKEEEAEREAEKAEREAEKAEREYKASLKCYTVSSGGDVSGGTIVGNHVTGGSMSPIIFHRICKDKNGNIVSKDRI